MILYLVKYTLKGQDIGVHLKTDHLTYLNKLYDEGTLLTAGLFIERVGGYLLFRTKTYEETKKLIENDPYIIHGVRVYTIEFWDVSPFPIKGID
ncbi:YciI family protein [Alkalicoccobacillus gibsonii]|uniref:YciI family protein n=1 Tax=Alkalicoccobacillus gibsonii TaxID=79881 RepID=UPI003511A7D6